METFSDEEIEYLKKNIHSHGSRWSSTKCGWVYDLLEKVKRNTRFIDPNKKHFKLRFWHIINGIDQIPKCSVCGNDTKFNNDKSFDFESPYREFCSRKCMDNLYLDRQKLSDKITEICGEKYTYIKVLVARGMVIKSTLYCTNHNIKFDQKVNNLIYSGCACPECRQEKMRIVYKENWGTEHPMQNSEFYENFLNTSYKKMKEYTLPSGRPISIQGYEPQALDYLLQNGYEESDILLGGEIEPWIWYNYENKKKRYFPDFYIKSENLIVEVKSTYTIKRNIERNKRKRQSCIDLGFQFVYMVVEIKKGAEAPLIKWLTD